MRRRELKEKGVGVWVRVEGEGKGTQDGGVARLTCACQANDNDSWIMTVVATDDYILAKKIFLQTTLEKLQYQSVGRGGLKLLV